MGIRRWLYLPYTVVAAKGQTMKRAKFRVGQVVCVKDRNWFGRISKIRTYPDEGFDLITIYHDGVFDWPIYSSRVRSLTTQEIGTRPKRGGKK